MDGQGHNRPPPPSGDIPYLPNFAADADPNLYPEQVVHQPQPRRSYWADQYRVMEETTDFEKQRIPLGTIERIMKADDDVYFISPEATGSGKNKNRERRPEEIKPLINII
ncbi:hypothetical protein KFK09_012576 [Dendrobium nobile]|uniref:Uncharacterized protein n=1 Tax=Dendrobium nobile TaxID=94219 RepID=A0A8T3BFV4_DENNO|nr:hypothetical protein KFK09_012576 [Dendrobium nobile]